jgi:hypothetical protein
LIATYIDSSYSTSKVPTTLADLLYFMQYTQQMNPLSGSGGEYFWLFASTKAEYVRGMVKSARAIKDPPTAANFMAALIPYAEQTVPKQGQKPPIAVVANCAVLALGMLLQ